VRDELHEDTIDLPGGTFQLLRAGRGERLAIVLHGFPDHPPTFAPLIEALAAAGYTVAAPWLRGYAPSTLDGPFHVDRLAADVLELATALGHERFVLVGHDWGAVITYTTCALAPERVLAAVTLAVPHPLAFLRSLTRSAQLLHSWYMLLFQLPGAPALARAAEHALIDRLWKLWSPGLRLDDDARAALHATLDASGSAPIGYYRALVRPPREALARTRRDAPTSQPIVTPLLHLQGADDGSMSRHSSRGQERYFHGPFRSELHEGLGHFLHLEAPALVTERTLGWLREHAPAS
jgi:pimeloyl-ACP methyl ester carboxylesterase